MRRILAWTMLLLLAPRLAPAAENIRMKNGQSLALPMSTVRCLIAEFLDPEATGLGVPIAFLVGGELLDAVRDVPGAAVLVSTDNDQEGIVTRLGSGYGHAALEIAREQRAMVAVWGTIEGTDSTALIECHLAQPSDSTSVQRLQLEWAGQPLEGISATSSARPLRFRARSVRRDELFSRPLVVVGPGCAVHGNPDRGSPTLMLLPKGQSIQAEDFRGSWWRVHLPDGRTGWLEHDVNLIRLPPRSVEALQKSEVRLTDDPGGAAGATWTLQGIYAVRDAQYRDGVLWLQIAPNPTAPERGWFPARLLSPHYDLPMVHFLTALYAYRSHRFPMACKRLGDFIAQAGTDEDNTVLSVAHQLLGWARLQMNPTDHDAMKEFDTAVELTPFDARTHAIRAFASLTAYGELREACLRDLDTALQLDGRDRTTQQLVTAIRKLQNQPPELRGEWGTIGHSMERRSGDVDRLYLKAAQYPDSIYRYSK